MLQRIDLCKFQPKQALKLTPLFLWPPRHGTSDRKRKECLQQTRKTHVAKDPRVV